MRLKKTKKIINNPLTFFFTSTNGGWEKLLTAH